MKNRKTLSLLFAIVFVLTMAIAGCSGNDSTTTEDNGDNDSSGNSENSDSGTLIIAELSDATQLDPHMGTDIPSANVYHGKIYEGLVKQDKNMDVQPALATDWKRIDELTWEFSLRKDVKFHDGTPFNAEAVKATFKRILDPELASSRAKLFEMITEFNIIDEHTIQLKTEYPFAPLLANLSHYSGGIISPSAIEEHGDELGQNPVGTGPFNFESWTPGQEIAIAKNENYWGDKAKVDNVIFKVIPEDSTRLGMVETGEAHIAEPVQITQLDRVEQSQSMKLSRTPGLGIDYIGFNTQKEPFDDVLVRQAINYAVDTDTILEGVYNNVGTEATAPMGPAVWGHNPDLEGYGYDPEKAKELLKEAGYPDGFKTTIWTNDNQARVDVSEVVQSQLKGVGIEVEIEVMEWGAYLDETSKGEHDMFVLGWSNMTGDADYNQYFLFHSDAKGAPGNRSFYSNPKVDELINAGRMEGDPEERKKIYGEAQKIEMEDAPLLLLRNDEDLIALNNDVEGFWMHPAGLLMINEVSIK
ncbi:glutathione ABC transporter substrate-binding protein [Virgibacillus byunsanensis]|uniref:Glutathione ABC transporter substrate-binding protein n=1 Tax=Virgibacillus byunsanensis TaxID=570945 RepID=A0ABW3LFY8_9BACI